VTALVVALSLPACSTGGCGGQKCAPAQLPSHALRLMVDDETIAPGGTAIVSLEVGRSTRFSLSIDRANGVSVSNVYLLVSGDHWTNGPGAPTGQVKILSHHVGTLSVGRSVVGTWLAARLFGSRKMYISARYDLGDASVGETAAQVRINP
jgi:hypothetical protein